MTTLRQTVPFPLINATNNSIHNHSQNHDFETKAALHLCDFSSCPGLMCTGETATQTKPHVHCEATVPSLPHASATQMDLLHQIYDRVRPE